MSIVVSCCKCKRELHDLGGLIFSPPQSPDFQENIFRKFHICKFCYNKLIEWLRKTK